MALTLSQVGTTNHQGDRKVSVWDATGDSSYPTGGESLTPGDLGFTVIYQLLATPNGGYVFEYDNANQKLLAYWVDTTTDGAPLVEAANATNLSSITTRVTVTGI